MGARITTGNRYTNRLAVCVFFLLCFRFAHVLHAASMPDYERLQPITTNLNAPTAVAVDAAGNIYVAQSVYNNLLIYDRDGGYLGMLSGLDRPLSVAVGRDGRIFVGNAGRGNVEVYDASLNLLHKVGAGDGEFARPSGLAVDSAGKVYVADSKEDRVKVYNPDGIYQFSFGTSGSDEGQFHFPASVAINETLGELIVADMPLIETWSGVQEGARIQVFDMNGGFLRSFGEFGQGEGLLTKPLGVAVDEDGRIYVTDAYQNIVQVFDGDGTYLGAVYDLDHPMRTPLGIAVGKATSRLFIASLNTSSVEVYAITNNSTSSPCYDFIGNGDGVGIAELEALATLWRQPAEPPYDSDDDGIVTVVDILQVSTHLGEVCN